MKPVHAKGLEYDLRPTQGVICASEILEDLAAWKK